MKFSRGYVSFILLVLIILAMLFAYGSMQQFNSLNPPLNSPIGNTGNRPQIAETIVQHLTPGSSTFYNKIRPNPFQYPGSSYLVKERPPNPPGNEDSTDAEGYIFCTALTIDTFNISGVKLPLDLLNTNTMISYWQSTHGYHFIDYWSAKKSGSQQAEKAALLQVTPGDAIWYANWDGTKPYCELSAAYCHTGMVYSVNINPFGDGIIETREANTPLTRKKLAVSSWLIVNYPDAASFGGIN